MRQLLEAGVHFGHQSHRWNPKMAPYIFGTRNNIHIIDLAQSVPMLHRALQEISDTVANGGRILFVGTKRQAQDAVSAAAKKSAQYYVNSRWLGGTLTNWKTISQSISRLRKLEEMLSSGESQGYTKKERLTLQRERDKLDRALGGIKDMGGLPDLLFVIDTNKEDIDQGGAPTRPAGSSDRRYKLRSGWYHLRGAGKRRCSPRNHILLRSRGKGGNRWNFACPGRFGVRCRCRGRADRRRGRGFSRNSRL